MTSRILACGFVVLALSSDVAGQATSQSAAQQPALLDVPDATRRQIEVTERNLRGAIDSAAAQLNKRLMEVIPSAQFQLQFQTTPLVDGVLMPEGDAVFHVLIPGIDGTASRVVDMLQRRPLINTSGGGTSDPAAMPASVKRMDPDEEYTTYARLALIEALLDNLLPIAPDRRVIVIAGELQPQGPNPFRPRSRSLILQINGEDLIALRTDRISRDDAKARIKEFRY